MAFSLMISVKKAARPGTSVDRSFAFTILKLTVLASDVNLMLYWEVEFGRYGLSGKHLSFSICILDLSLKENRNPISFNDKSKITNGK